MTYLGMTHCEDCGKSLNLVEYGICKECKEKYIQKDKVRKVLEQCYLDKEEIRKLVGYRMEGK